MHAFIAALPKAELHLHIEGSFEPELMFAIAQRNQVPLKYPTVEALRAAYDFNRLQDFLDIYYQGMAVLLHERDFFDLCWAYLERAMADNVRHVEIFFDPQAHTARGVAFETVLNGLYGALSQAQQQHGLSFKLIMCFLRHLPEQQALETLALAEPHLDKIDGVGLDSSEQGFPPSGFVQVFERARALGLHTVAHAGEEGPPEYIWQALDLLKVERIDHGNRALEEPALVVELARRQIPLTVCPLSNLKLCVVDDLANHPIRQMLDASLMAMINSDDPAYFGGYVNENFFALEQALGLTQTEVLRLVNNSFEAAFLSPEQKQQYLAEVAAVAAQYT